MPEPPKDRSAAPFRQIRLNFDVDGSMGCLAAEFDADKYAEMLQRSHVESVTFAGLTREGWIYHDSAQFPERVHPGLDRRNLLSEQIEACHKRNIKVSAYVSVAFDTFAAKRHPEWHVVTPTEAHGAMLETPHALCLGSPYREFCKSFVADLIRIHPLDGIEFDFGLPPECSCAACVSKISAEGRDATSTAARCGYAIRLREDFVVEMTALVGSIRAETILSVNNCLNMNLTTIVTAYQEAFPSLDSLRIMSQAGRLYDNSLNGVGRIDRFEASHEDLWDRKTLRALEADSFHLLSSGFRVQIDDAMHPSGKTDEETYRRVGAVFGQIQLKEPWSRNATPLFDIGVLDPFGRKSGCLTSGGAEQILDESGHQYDVIATTSDFAAFRLLILPDEITVEDDVATKIEAFIAQGGAVIGSYKSGMSTDETRFHPRVFGVALREQDSAMAGHETPDGLKPNEVYEVAAYSRLQPLGALAKGLPDAEFSTNSTSSALPITPLAGAEVLARVRTDIGGLAARSTLADASVPTKSKSEPAASETAGFPAAVLRGKSLYFAHDVFTLYNEFASPSLKRVLTNAIDLLLPAPLLRHDGPSTLRTTVHEQQTENRWVIHLLHYTMQQSNSGLPYLDDLVPIDDVKITLHVPRTVKRVQLRPGWHDELDFWTTSTPGANSNEVDHFIEFVVPRIHGHQMVSIEFEETENQNLNGFHISGAEVPGLHALDQAMARVLTEHDAPGVSLAVMRHGLLFYARGFGWADLQSMEPVRPTSLFRIASISKPVTAVGILKLVQDGKLSLDDRIFDILPFEPFRSPGADPDPRTREITIRHCLNHTGGWDRARSGDLMFFPVEIAQALGAPPPAGQAEIIRYACGRPLDSAPGQAYAYSNYGYCLLGRIIEQRTGRVYEEWTRAEILAPIGISTMRIGKTLFAGRAPDEVAYYPVNDFQRSVFAETLGLRVPHPYGAWHLEAMDSHGGWIASAVDIARFASAFHDFDRSPVLTRASIESMFARPPEPVGLDDQGKPKKSWYGLGWSVDQPRGDAPGQQHHNGMLHGTATVMRRRDDGVCWAVLFNQAIGRKEAYIGGAVATLVGAALAGITDWPEVEAIL